MSRTYARYQSLFRLRVFNNLVILPHKGIRAGCINYELVSEDHAFFFGKTKGMEAGDGRKSCMEGT